MNPPTLIPLCRRATLGVLLALTTACGRQHSEPSGTTQPALAQPSASPAAAARPPAAAPSSALSWTMPSTWKEQPARAMRRATYQATGAAGAAEIAVFYFGVDQGGSVEENITRWVKQFQDLPDDQVRRDQLNVHGMQVSTVRIAQGTFASGMPGGPAQSQEGWGMNAAVVETPEGPYFFKMTGPAATVDAEEGAFLALLQSIELKK